MALKGSGAALPHAHAALLDHFVLAGRVAAWDVRVDLRRHDRHLVLEVAEELIVDLFLLEQEVVLVGEDAANLSHGPLDAQHAVTGDPLRSEFRSGKDQDMPVGARAGAWLVRCRARGTGLRGDQHGSVDLGIATAVIASFLGGLVAGMSAAVGGRSRGLLNGLMVGASAIVAMLVLIGAGAGTLLGAGATALGDVVSIGQQLNVSQEVNAAVDAFDRAESSAWGSFIGLTLAVVLAGLGGLVGARGRAIDEPKRR